eukprot:360770-Chlamydomonas_euryale.AAC.1
MVRSINPRIFKAQGPAVHDLSHFIHTFLPLLEGGPFWRHGLNAGLRFELSVHHKAVVHSLGFPMIPLSPQTSMASAMVWQIFQKAVTLKGHSALIPRLAMCCQHFQLVDDLISRGQHYSVCEGVVLTTFVTVSPAPRASTPPASRHEATQPALTSPQRPRPCARGPGAYLKRDAHAVQPEVGVFAIHLRWLQPRCLHLHFADLALALSLDVRRVAHRAPRAPTVRSPQGSTAAGGSGRVGSVAARAGVGRAAARTAAKTSGIGRCPQLTANQQAEAGKGGGGPTSGEGGGSGGTAGVQPTSNASAPDASRDRATARARTAAAGGAGSAGDGR